MIARDKILLSIFFLSLPNRWNNNNKKHLNVVVTARWFSGRRLTKKCSLGSVSGEEKRNYGDQKSEVTHNHLHSDTLADADFSEQTMLETHAKTKSSCLMRLHWVLTDSRGRELTCKRGCSATYSPAGVTQDASVFCCSSQKRRLRAESFWVGLPGSSPLRVLYRYLVSPTGQRHAHLADWQHCFRVRTCDELATCPVCHQAFAPTLP